MTSIKRHAEGANYSVDVDGKIAIVTVWRRPDLSFDEGARLAVEISGHLQGVTEGKLPGVNAVVLDLRNAPELVGKKTRDAVGFVLARCEALAIRFAVVIGSPTQSVIMEHVTRGGPPNFVRTVQDFDEAMRWAAGKDE